MRTFYIFNINEEMAILSKSTPYTIFKSLDQIKKMSKKDLDMGIKIFEQIVTPFNNKIINQKIFKEYKNNDYYQKYLNTHLIFNKYRPEETKLTLRNSYLTLESNVVKPAFLKELKEYRNIFVCDFNNRDYFWLEQLSI